MLKDFNFSCINLWCTKNLVDSQYLLGKIFSSTQKQIGLNLKYFSDPKDFNVQYVFLNTCWFLSTWRQEMIDEIKSLLKNKKKIIIIGCGLKYFQLAKNFPKSDINSQKEISSRNKLIKNKNISFLSWSDLDKFSLQSIIKQKNINFTNSDYFFSNSPRAYTNASLWFEYLKIAEWCDTCCTFCIIPKIRWKQKSQTIPKILSEVKNIINTWIQEIILIAQDSSRYWMDIYRQPSLIKLLQEIDKIPGKFQYRVLYVYPDFLNSKFLLQLQKLKKFVPYFDIPLQHISWELLKKMWRHYSTQNIINILNQIKKIFPIRFIRTNFIIWFPGETEKHFNQLISFIKKFNFDNIALFEYHDEPMAASFKLPDKVNPKIIRQRFVKLQKLVNQILNQKQKSRIWKIYQWTIVEILKWKKFSIRPQISSPEIDPCDKINFNQLISFITQQKKSEINIWDKINYKLKN